jgi:hypothetical protein
MKDPCFNLKFASFVGVALLALDPAGFAQPTDKPAAPRTKAQVIYHLPASSANAAALHSQDKAQNSNPAAEGSPPATPQISHENPAPSASAIPKRPESVAASPQQRQIKRTKESPNRSVRPQPAKTKGPGNSGHGNSGHGKSHKK